MCAGCAARARRCALAVAAAQRRTGPGPAHRGAAFRRDTPVQPHATPGPRGASLLVPPPHPAASRGTGPWLQFWLQFTRVRRTPGEYTHPGQNPPGPLRTVDNRAFNPWVQGSSPWRPTDRDISTPYGHADL